MRELLKIYQNASYFFGLDHRANKRGGMPVSVSYAVFYRANRASRWVMYPFAEKMMAPPIQTQTVGTSLKAKNAMIATKGSLANSKGCS